MGVAGLGPVPGFWARKRARARARGSRSNGLSMVAKVCCMRRPRCFVCSWTSGSGASLRLPDRLGETTVTSWRRCCGGGGPALRGEISPATLAPGRRCSIGSTAGRARVSGSVCSRRSVRTTTMGGTASTALSLGDVQSLVIQPHPASSARPLTLFRFFRARARARARLRGSSAI
jgi:hypothetical protein